MAVLTVLRALVNLAGPWLVGDPEGFGDVDTMPLREHDGSLQVPATSLAGSLRDHLDRWPGIDAIAWMGDLRRDDDRSGGPSRLRVLGVRLVGGDDTVIRSSTAVDPATGSALPKTLRREEHVDARTTITIYLQHHGAPDRQLVDALARWRPLIGRRRTNGWGTATVTELKYATVDLRDRRQLVGWLAGGDPHDVDQLVAAGSAHQVPTATPAALDVIRIRFEVPVGVHVGTGELEEAGEEDGEERRVAVAGIVSRDSTPYVPASSWRGVLRGQVAFILRSLGCPAEATRSAVEDLFGGLRRRGLLTFHDAPLQPAGADAGEQEQKHVGIDRITGGARANLLFADRSARGTVGLHVTAEDPDALPQWAHAALGHAMRDLADGFLAIGGRTTRGLGTLRLLTDADAVVPAADGIDITAVAADPLKES